MSRKKPNLHLSADSLVNVASGLGTARGKRFHNQFVFDQFTTWGEMDAAYQSNWLARQIVDVPAEDMTREWRTIKSKYADEIRIVEDQLMLPNHVLEALCWSRLYGGGGILMLTGQDLTKPLNVSKIRKSSLERIIVFDRFDMNALNINQTNVLASNYLQPEFYSLSNANGQQIHWSHFARFGGARIPRRLMAQTQGWGDSELRKCLADLRDTVSAKDGIAELMQEANVDVIKREGLAQEIATDQEEAITNRYALFGQMKSVVKLALLDGEETYDRKTLQLSGVADVLKVFMTWISGAADIPVTRLFGQSAQGMNATGEGDLKNYYNSIRAKQLSQVDPGLRTLDEVLVRSALGFWPDDFNYVWNPLQQPDQLQQAQARQVQSQTDQSYLNMGAATVDMIARNLESNEAYQYPEGFIDGLETEENPQDGDDYMQQINELVANGTSVADAIAQLG